MKGLLNVKEFLFGCLVFLIYLFIETIVLMLLWNACIPEIFGLRNIDYFQSVCLCLISWILFKNNVSTSK